MRTRTVALQTRTIIAYNDRIANKHTQFLRHKAHAHHYYDLLKPTDHPITSTHTIVSNHVSYIQNTVVTHCAVQAGDPGAFSVLPGTATLVGTVRSFDPVVQELVEQRLKELCSAIALGFGATATLHS